MNRFTTCLFAALVGAATACSGSPPPSDEKPKETTPAETTVSEVEEAPEPEATPQSALAPDLSELPDEGTAEGVAARVIMAHGGESLDDAIQVNFEFVVVNAGEEVFTARHSWDRKNHRDRVEWTQEGKKILAAVDLKNPTVGWVRVDGGPAGRADIAKYLDAARARWVNDVYWGFMPFKLLDEGVNLALVEDRKVDGKTYTVLEVTFDEVGLTPGDTYWVYVDPETYTVDRWEMLLSGAKEGVEPTPVTWEDYREISGLKIPHNHAVVGTPRRIQYRNVEIFSKVDNNLYSEPIVETTAPDEE